MQYRIKNAYKDPFNRTTLELKFRKLPVVLFEVSPFNRTTLELKFGISWQIKNLPLTFNRTTLELKLKYASRLLPLITNF